MIVDLPNQILRQNCRRPTQELIIPAMHQVYAIKAPEPLDKPEWLKDVEDVANQYPHVWARNKLQCGQIKDEVMVVGPNPQPLLQYKYLKESEPSVKETVRALQ